MSQQVPEIALRVHETLQTSLPYFARHALKVKDKKGALVPFVFNRAQEYVHTRIETQKEKKGWVRVLILKGRQQGCSTYVAARFYHKSTRNQGQSVFILSHEASTTDKLFRIVERYQSNCPPPLRPATKIANRREYQFSELGSDYAVGTAGNENVGRGGTVQLFHGSEVAFWENTDQIETGVMQSVPDTEGSEIILESTANGMQGLFYEKCMEALRGEGRYELIFVPWFWQIEYRMPLPDDFQITQEEEALAHQYKLDLEQIVWRREKIRELKSEWKFKQEYPSNVMEAFQTSGESLIKPEAIMGARKSELTDDYSPLVIGVDPGRNRDRTVFVYRRGRQILKYEIFKPKDRTRLSARGWQMYVAGILAKRIDRDQPEKIFMDVGEGWGIYDRLFEQGYGDVVTPVHFGETALESDVYANKRAEMWCTFRDWLHGEDGEVRIPDDDVFHADIACMPDTKQTSSNLIQLEAKDQIRKRFKRSPDIGDASALTFAYPVKRGHNAATRITRKQGNASQLKTLSRMRGEGHKTAMSIITRRK